MEPQNLPSDNNQNLIENGKVSQENTEKTEKQENLNTENIIKQDNTENKDGSGVYERDVYSKPEFWNERFKATRGYFDWYTEWENLKKILD